MAQESISSGARPPGPASLAKMGKKVIPVKKLGQVRSPSRGAGLSSRTAHLSQPEDDSWATRAPADVEADRQMDDQPVRKLPSRRARTSVRGTRGTTAPAPSTAAASSAHKGKSRAKSVRATSPSGSSAAAKRKASKDCPKPFPRWVSLSSSFWICNGAWS